MASFSLSESAMARMSFWWGAIGLGVAVTAAVGAATAVVEKAPVRRSPAGYAQAAHPGRVIVKFRDRTTTLSVARATTHSGPQAATMLASRLGVALADGRILGLRTQVLTSTQMDSTTLAATLAREADVEWAVVDQRRFVQTAPSDPLYPAGLSTTTAPYGPSAGQWYLRAPDATAVPPIVSSINMEPAWAITTGSSSVVIADVDTGITAHPDLSTKVFATTATGTTLSNAYGYSFVGYNPTDDTGALTANGINAGPDPSDPGDWITAAENAGTVDGGAFKGCGESDSSWHGTQTAGILAAATNNATGMAGVGYNTMVVPVRALGKCGGYDSDIIAAALWAGGVMQSSWMDGTSQATVPTNTHPARVINMSLGATGACTSAYVDNFTLLRNAGVFVVAAAGNDEGLAVDSPANCQPDPTDTDQTPIVVAVAGLRHAGDKVGYSDVGPQVTIAAPAGNCVNTAANAPCLYPILTTVNTGLTSPVSVANGGATYSTSGYSAAGVADPQTSEVSLGTSFATPMVSGTIALMLAAAPNLGNKQLISLLQSTATPFPTSGGSAGTPVCTAPTTAAQDECYCTTTTCGAGMLNAGAAVAAAAATVPPVAAISGGTSVAVGGTLTLSAAGSTAAGSTITGYTWSLAAGAGDATLSSTTGSSVTLTGSAAGTATVQLTVADAAGLSGSTTSTVTVTAGTSPTSPTTSSGGGGAANPLWLALLVLAGLLLRRRGQA
jgi:serine protease